jgi:hypothetical protein
MSRTRQTTSGLLGQKQGGGGLVVVNPFQQAIVWS